MCQKKTKRASKLPNEPCLVNMWRGFLKREELEEVVLVGVVEVEGGLQEWDEEGEELFSTVSLLRKLF